MNYNISKPEKFTGRDGKERTSWNTVGIVIPYKTKEGETRMIVKIPAISLEATAFPMKPKEEKAEEKEINPEDLPFS